MVKSFYNLGHFEDPREIGFSLMDLDSDTEFIKGTKNQFMNRNIVFFVFILLFKYVFDNQIPNILHIFFLVAALYFLMLWTFSYMRFSNKLINKAGVFGVFLMISILLMLIIILSAFF